MALVMDAAAAAAMTNSDVKVKAIPDGASSIAFDTDGTASTQATVNLGVYHVERIRDYMFSDLAVPTYAGDDYMCVISTKAKRNLVRDDDWEKWHQYTNPSVKFNSEIGRIENIRFVESGNQNALADDLGASGVLGEAIFFGEDFCSMAVAQDPELRVEIPQDFGRKQAVAWYGILEFGIPWDTANSGEARGVHLTSS
jgi:N4-gp56 family major capsid protein